jgi:hypothetical protein
MAGRADWLEPFPNLIISAKNADKIAVSASLQQKRVLALEVFGSNLVLDRKIARGCCVKPWSLLVKKSLTGGMVRQQGLKFAQAGLDFPRLADVAGHRVERFQPVARDAENGGIIPRNFA